MREYDVFLPLAYNDGSPVEQEKFDDARKRLLDEFGGVTFFPHPSEGSWRSDEGVDETRVVLFRVVAKDARKARRFLGELKERLKEAFRQKTILIVERAVEIL